MKTKINKILLEKSQEYARKLNHPILQTLQKQSYTHLQQFYSNVVKPFDKILIDGAYPQNIIPYLNTRGQSSSQIHVIKQLLIDQSQYKKDSVNNAQHWNNVSIIQSQKVQKQQYDLILSSLRPHHQDFQTIMKKYNKQLNSDGAIICSLWTQQSLQELRWSFLMAENQRSGGISPKVMHFPSLSQVGQILTVQRYHMPTIITHQIQLELQSVVDLLTLLQITGESGYLHGKRKGVYKDVLLAMAALYDTQFINQKQKDSKAIQINQNEDQNQKVYNIKASLQMAVFIAWKYHESQPKALKRGQNIGQDFFDFLKKQDPELKKYKITEDNDQPEQQK